jgi:hypothetical protein
LCPDPEASRFTSSTLSPELRPLSEATWIIAFTTCGDHLWVDEVLSVDGVLAVAFSSITAFNCFGDFGFLARVVFFGGAAALSTA